MKGSSKSVRAGSVWIESAPVGGDREHPHAQETDVVVVGAGITGLTAALALKQAGRSVTVLDAGRPGWGTTGHSSAHASAVPDAGYASIAIKHGRETAARIGAGLREALDVIEKRGQACDWQRAPAFLYAASESDLDVIEREAEALAAAGFDVSKIDSAPLPSGTLPGMRIENQGIFHPLRYIAALAEQLESLNVPILSGCLAQEVEELNDAAAVTTRRNRMLAREVVLATHFPWSLLTESEAIPHRSYLVAMETNSPLPLGLFWDTSHPYHYTRGIEIDGQALTLIGGADHRTGYFRDDDWRAYAALEAYARNHLAATRPRYRWSAQYYEPVDGLPYIGRAPGKQHLWIASGYSGNGLAFGALAGQLIADAICGAEPPLLDDLSPSRLADIASIPTLLAENVRSGYRMIRDRALRQTEEEMAALAPGEGSVFDCGKELVAASRTEQGKLIERCAVCPHKGGIVEWNPIERSWDCPIHGGRYARSGKRLEGPPTRGLRKRSSRE